MRVLLVDLSPSELADLLAYLGPHVQLSHPSPAGGVEGWLAQQGLSPREVEVVLLDLAGYSRAEIAAQLCLSPITVSNYWGRIYSKLQVHSRTEMRHLLRQAQAPLLARSVNA